MTEANGLLATTIVQRYGNRFGRGPTEAKYIGRDFARIELSDDEIEVARGDADQADATFRSSLCQNRWPPERARQD